MTQAPDSARSAPPPRLLGLDGWRGLGALGIVMGHIVISTVNASAISAAFTAVQPLHACLTMFFVLSGFLIYLPFASALVSGRRLPRTGRFLANRALRVFPAYLVIFLVVNFVFASSNTTNVQVAAVAEQSPLGTISDPGTLAANLLLVQSLSPDWISTGILPAWSLTSELGFYLAVPVLAALGVFIALRVRAPRVVAVFVPGVILLALGLAANITLVASSVGLDADALAARTWGRTWEAVLLHSTIGCADGFGIGALAAAVLAMLQSGKLRLPSPTVVRASWVMVALLAAIALTFHVNDLVWAFTLTTAVGSAIAMLLLAIAPAVGDPSRNVLVRLFEWRPARFLGLISLSLYLWHYPVLYWVHQHGLRIHDYPSLLSVGSLVVALSLVLSTATYFLVEAPTSRVLRRRRPSAGPELIAVGAATAHPARPQTDGPVVPVVVPQARLIGRMTAAFRRGTAA
ncbi:acyltransferase family protein [Agromyces intestinalis]|uniref:acyltransferase family protein n=1 Tax=Agromyces intestinalis TaxID=2592652 RepID=UPI00143DBF4A|nr:acyltransferase [Agromyces intestinalis]